MAKVVYPAVNFLAQEDVLKVANFLPSQFDEKAYVDIDDS